MPDDKIRLDERHEDKIQRAIGHGTPLEYVAWYFQVPLAVVERLAGDDAPGHAHYYEPTLAEIAEHCRRFREPHARRPRRRFSADERLKMLALRALGYTYREIAREIGTADGTAWSVIHRPSPLDN